MKIELESKEIKVSTCLYKDSSQKIIEGDVIVPDVKPDVVLILHTDGKVKINSKEVHKDVVVVRGTVDFKVLYMSDDPSRYICNIDHSINFDQTIDIKTDDANINSFVDYSIEHIDATILNGRKINLKAILNSKTKVIKDLGVSAVSNIRGENVQVLTQPVNISKDFDGNVFNTVVDWEEDIPIGKPAVQEILRFDASVKDIDTKITGGKVIVKGNIEVKSLYVPDMNESPIDFITSEVPFSEVIDLEELDDNKELDLELKVADVKAGVKADEDGDFRIMDYQVSIDFKPSYMGKQVFELVSDAYSTNSKLELETKLVKVLNIVESRQVQTTVKDVAQVLSEKLVINQVYSVLYKPAVMDVNIEKDKVIVEGIIDATVIYLTKNEEQPLKSFNHQIPFNSVIEVKGIIPSMKAEAKIKINNYSYSIINEKEVELKFNMVTSVKVLKEELYNVVTNVNEMPLVEDDKAKALQPSMIVYYVQSGDTLWSIAKKYLTTVDELAKLNAISNPNDLDIGQQLLIPKTS